MGDKKKPTGTASSLGVPAGTGKTVAGEGTRSSQRSSGMNMPEVALAFCKECRGWEKAIYMDDFGYPYIFEEVSKELADTPILPYERQFHYRRLDEVMKAVRGYVQPVDITPPHHAALFARVIPDVFSRYFVGALDEAGLCYELMAACVEAERRGKGIPAAPDNSFLASREAEAEGMRQELRTRLGESVYLVEDLRELRASDAADEASSR